MFRHKAPAALLSAGFVLGLFGCGTGSEAQESVQEPAPKSGPAPAQNPAPNLAQNTAEEAPPVEPAEPEALNASSVYALGAETLGGEAVSLDQYQGKVTVFVNVASKCGYTKHYAGLQTLHEELGGEDFAIVGIPSNDFGGQEPGSADEIRAFCTQNYGVTFDMLAKTGTKEGDSPLFDRFAALSGERPGWNFCKFVVSKDGDEVKFFPSKIAPDSGELRGAIDGFLAN